MLPRLLAIATTSGFLLAANAGAQGVDATAAESLSRKSKCSTCHTVDKKKDGPSYKEVAAKYKGNAEAEKKLFTHLTTGSKVKVDGKEETHEPIKGANDAGIRNLVAWILSR